MCSHVVYMIHICIHTLLINTYMHIFIFDHIVIGSYCYVCLTMEIIEERRGRLNKNFSISLDGASY
jgi:hypothetical protein